jgi:hypothetical protein
VSDFSLIYIVSIDFSVPDSRPLPFSIEMSFIWSTFSTERLLVFSCDQTLENE